MKDLYYLKSLIGSIYPDEALIIRKSFDDYVYRVYLGEEELLAMTPEVIQDLKEYYTHNQVLPFLKNAIDNGGDFKISLDLVHSKPCELASYESGGGI